ncbi:MAG: lipocalin family protein [Gemmataceae bacterium]
MVRICFAIMCCLVAVGRASAGSLDGTWEITSLIEDGAVIAPAAIKETLAKSGMLVIAGQTIALTRPNTSEKRTILFVINDKVNPPTIDLAGADKVGSRGIYLQTGDTVLICLSGPEVADRPREFASQPGSHAILMTLRRVTAPAAPAAAPLPPAPVQQVLTDDAVRKLLVGTWGFQNPDEVHYSTFTADGSFTATRTWKKGLKKLFDGETRSSGSWKLENGVLVIKVTASTERDMQGQTYTYRVNSITAREMILLGSDGGVRREWKVSSF